MESRTSPNLTAATMKEFTKGLTDSLAHFGPTHKAEIVLSFYPRFSFLTYGFTFVEGGCSAAIQRYLKEEGYFGNVLTRAARELTAASSVENALHLPLRQVGFALAKKSYVEGGRSDMLGRVTWWALPQVS